MFRKKQEVYQPPAPVLAKGAELLMVEFTGAEILFDDDGRKVDWTPREKICVNIARVDGYYDHTILVDGRKIRVMETYAQIALKILEAMK